MFSFKKFVINDTHCAMKVGTDGVLLGAWSNVALARHILDLGCGSGLIALMAAQRQPAANVVGVELIREAADDACANVAASPFANRVSITCADITDYPAPYPRFDCILSNPPYHQEELLPPSATRAAARHTAGGGLNFDMLLNNVDRLLDKQNPQAVFAVVLPAVAASRFITMAHIHGLHLTRRTDVVTRHGKVCKRVLLEFGVIATPTLHNELELLSPDGKRSEAYAQLCADFYL